jgi:hypothetical protein
MELRDDDEYGAGLSGSEADEDAVADDEPESPAVQSSADFVELTPVADARICRNGTNTLVVPKRGYPWFSA